MKFQFGKLFDNKTFLKIFSLLLAIICWLIVVTTVNRSVTWNFDNVEVDLTAQQADVLIPIGLNIVEGIGQTVTVKVQGDRDVITNLKPNEDILITADLVGARIIEPGLYENVKLIGTDVNKKQIKFESIDPPVVSLRVDRMSTKKIPVQADVEGLKIPDGYLGAETIVNPSEVQITGPDADVQRVAKCVVSASFEEPLTKTTTVKRPITLYDSEGNELSSDLLTLSIDSVNMTVPVNKQKRVPVKFEYIDIPDAFPTHLLEDKLSQGYIDVAGPENLVDAYDVCNLGYVNINEITHDKVFVFPISLPNGFVNIGNIDSISLQFDMTNITSGIFAIPGENIIVKNVPANYTVSVTSPSITGVQMLGSSEVMDVLSGQDIIAEIDMFVQDNIAAGPYSLPVQISVPNKEFAWATGKYTAVVNIKEKD